MSSRNASPHDLLLLNELLQLKLAACESGRPLTYAEAWRLVRAFSIRLRCRYPARLICQAWNISRSTLYRHKNTAALTAADKPQSHPCTFTDAALAARLREMLADSPFPAERHRKLWARLKRAGILVCRERLRRILRDYALVPQRGTGILMPRPDLMWGMDSAKVKTLMGGAGLVLFLVDHCTAECLACDVVQEETSAAWHRVIAAAVAHAKGTVFPGVVRGLKLRHDNLPLFRTPEFREPLRQLGIQFSRSPILSPWMNGCAERFVRTLRENLLVLRSFPTLTELKHAVQEFRNTYNRDWLLTRADYRSPSELREMFTAHSI
jgi:transposase InsO family protein